MELSVSTPFNLLGRPSHRTPSRPYQTFRRTEYRTVGTTIRGFLVKALLPYQIWSDRWGYRSVLRKYLRISAHLVGDLGLTIEEAKSESELPFWRSGITP